MVAVYEVGSSNSCNCQSLCHVQCGSYGGKLKDETSRTKRSQDMPSSSVLRVPMTWLATPGAAKQWTSVPFELENGPDQSKHAEEGTSEEYRQFKLI